MVKKCIYCKIPLLEDSVIDVCDRCGYKVWGRRMFSTIRDNMESAREEGDLNQGSVTDSLDSGEESGNSFP